MILAAKQIINSKIISSAPEGPRRDKKTVAGFHIDPTEAKIYALGLDQDEFVLFSDIKKIKKNQQIITIVKVKSINNGKLKSPELFNKLITLIDSEAVTEDGEILGHVKDFEFDDISGRIVTYLVKTSLVPKLFKGHLAINRNQVIALKKDRIIVKNSVIRSPKRIKIWKKKQEEIPAGATVAER